MPLRRLLTPLLLVAVVIMGGAGCTPEPEPTPTPTGFANADEAFAAAEQTYRAYVDALNEVDLADPATFEPVYDWSTGDFNSEERRVFSEYHADKLTVSGESVVTLVEPVRWDEQEGLIEMAVCVDVSGVDLVDAAGISVVSPDRVDVQSTTVTLSRGSSPTSLLIVDITGREGEPPCSE